MLKGLLVICSKKLTFYITFYTSKYFFSNQEKSMYWELALFQLLLDNILSFNFTILQNPNTVKKQHGAAKMSLPVCAMLGKFGNILSYIFIIIVNTNTLAKQP